MGQNMDQPSSIVEASSKCEVASYKTNENLHQYLLSQGFLTQDLLMKELMKTEIKDERVLECMRQSLILEIPLRSDRFNTSPQPSNIVRVFQMGDLTQPLAVIELEGNTEVVTDAVVYTQYTKGQFTGLHNLPSNGRGLYNSTKAGEKLKSRKVLTILGKEYNYQISFEFDPKGKLLPLAPQKVEDMRERV